jgi:hypothetical protein
MIPEEKMRGYEGFGGFDGTPLAVVQAEVSPMDILRI